MTGSESGLASGRVASIVVGKGVATAAEVPLEAIRGGTGIPIPVNR